MGKSIKTFLGKARGHLVALATAAFFSTPALALEKGGFDNPLGSSKTTSDLANIVNGAIPLVFSFAVVIALVIIIWQGLKMVGGNPQAAEAAKGTIIRVLIGLAVIVLATAIVNVVTSNLITVSANAM